MEIFSALLAICAGNSPASGEFPALRPVTRSFDVFFDLCLNKRLRKQSWGWWFETLLCPLWRHCNVINLLVTTHNLCHCYPFFSMSCPWHPCSQCHQLPISSWLWLQYDHWPTPWWRRQTTARIRWIHLVCGNGIQWFIYSWRGS